MDVALGPRTEAPLVVFDFDHTLYDGDSGGDMVLWLLRRSWLRALAAIAASVVLLPMLAVVPTRRRGISGYLWLGTFGLRDYHDLNALIRRYRDLIWNTLDHGLSNARSEATNTHLRALTKRAYGFHSPDALIAMAMLTRGGLCPALPGRK